jgi:hypothetical protein
MNKKERIRSKKKKVERASSIHSKENHISEGRFIKKKAVT